MFFLAVCLLFAGVIADSQPPSILNIYGFPRNQAGFFQTASPERAVPLKDLYSGPVVVVADPSRSSDIDKSVFDDFNEKVLGRNYTAYYLLNGLRSLQDEVAFKPLYDHILSWGSISGLAFRYDGLLNNAFTKNRVDQLVLPSGTSVQAFSQVVTSDPPFLFVLPDTKLSQAKFNGALNVGYFVFNDRTKETDMVSNFVDPVF